MNSNAKILVVVCIIIILSGFIFLWIGLNTKQDNEVALPPSGILVTKVIDGDTFEIEDGKRVRILGVDTPETKDPRKPVQCFGKEASNKNKELLEGKRVILEKDITDKDKYNRLLRFVYLPLEDGSLLFVNDYLIREGYAMVLTIPPDVKFAEQFLKAQKQARMEKRGLWQKCW